MALGRALFVSRSLIGGDRHGVDALVNAARLRNAASDISAALFWTERQFLQVLEGDEAILDTFLDRIAADPRHTGFTILQSRPVKRRLFDKWSMKALDGERYLHLQRYFDYGRLRTMRGAALDKRVALLARLAAANGRLR